MRAQYFALPIILVLKSSTAIASTDFGAVLARTQGLSLLSRLFETDSTLFDAVQDPVDVTFLAPTDEAMTEFLRVTRRHSRSYLQ